MMQMNESEKKTCNALCYVMLCYVGRLRSALYCFFKGRERERERERERKLINEGRKEKKDRQKKRRKRE